MEHDFKWLVFWSTRSINYYYGLSKHVVQRFLDRISTIVVLSYCPATFSLRIHDILELLPRCWNYSWLWVQRNYRFFYMFVFSTTLLCLYVHGFCWVYIRKIMGSENSSIWKAMAKTPASVVLIIYTFLALWFVGGLSIFHFYLISTNQVKSPFLCAYSTMSFFLCFGLHIYAYYAFILSIETT